MFLAVFSTGFRPFRTVRPLLRCALLLACAGRLGLPGAAPAAVLEEVAGPGLKALFPLPGGAPLKVHARGLLAASPIVGARGMGRPVGYLNQGEKERRQRSRTPLYLSSALALSAGVFAYWTKDEADAAYENYRKAAGQLRQDEQFDRAERYDRISALGFALMEAGLVWTTYLVFF